MNLFIGKKIKVALAEQCVAYVICYNQLGDTKGCLLLCSLFIIRVCGGKCITNEVRMCFYYLYAVN